MIDKGQMENKIICFDLDGTLCSAEKIYNKQYAKPHQDIIDKVNELYYLGNKIIIFTNRNNLEWQTTVDWLAEHNVEYHQLIMNKPYYDVYVGDKSHNVKDYYE